MPDPAARHALLPAPTLPLAWFAAAHAAFALACAVLVLRPSLPGPFHFHPQLIAALHLVTLGWITGSILGALYIVAPLALGVPLRATALDRAAWFTFWIGAGAMVAGFWLRRYGVVGHGATLVLLPAAFVGWRVVAGLRRARLPAGVSIHVAFAFINLLAAGLFGAFGAMNYVSGVLPWAPYNVALAHAHLSVLGWATMMFFGVAYRLIPMFIPAAMPTGRGLMVSALLLEAGVLGLAVALLAGTTLVPWALCVVAAFGSFFRQVRAMLRSRRPRPPDLPRPDWSTWQTHAAMLCLLIATALGVWLATGLAPLSVTWAYGTLGIVGFLAQAVVGIGGRLLPLQAWYRPLADGQTSARSVHTLADPRIARAVLVLWLIGVPLLVAGLMAQSAWLVRGGSLALFTATLANAAHIRIIVRRAARPSSAAG
jgi:hypothetical protein